jgi:hypothetical protein
MIAVLLSIAVAMCPPWHASSQSRFGLIDLAGLVDSGIISFRTFGSADYGGCECLKAMCRCAGKSCSFSCSSPSFSRPLPVAVVGGYDFAI